MLKCLGYLEDLKHRSIEDDLELFPVPETGPGELTSRKPNEVEGVIEISRSTSSEGTPRLVSASRSTGLPRRPQGSYSVSVTSPLPTRNSIEKKRIVTTQSTTTSTSTTSTTEPPNTIRPEVTKKE
jgi:hypothetical protein